MLQWMLENGYRVKGKTRDTEGLLKILLRKRVDAVMANNYVMEALLKEYGVENRVKVFLNRHKPLGVYFSRGLVNSRPGFIEEFNRIVPECREILGKD